MRWTTANLIELMSGLDAGETRLIDLITPDRKGSRKGQDRYRASACLMRIMAKDVI